MVSGKPAADRVTDLLETAYVVEVSVCRTIALGRPLDQHLALPA